LVKKVFKPEGNSGRDHKRPYNLYLKQKPSNQWAAPRIYRQMIKKNVHFKQEKNKAKMKNAGLKAVERRIFNVELLWF